MKSRATHVVPDDCDTLALCGGPYSNFGAVEAFLAATAGLPRFCLGDLGGFGPLPDRTIDLLRSARVPCLQGNYDHAVGHDERDCGCGYVDARDREYAQLSFDYTAANTHAANKAWLRNLPVQMLIEWRGARVLLVHGSPESVNEFVWQSETGDGAIDAWLAREAVDGICATHSGLPWVRRTVRGFWCNVGVLGRPPHDGTPRVSYALLRRTGATIEPVLVPLEYDVAPVAAAMRAEGLPETFVDSLVRGIWTTCFNILPPAERETAGRYADARANSLSPTVPHARHAAPAEGN